MKKILMTALVLVAGASLFTASAASKKKVKKAATLVELKSSADSLSYVAGMNATRGLIPYIQQSFQVDTAYMENFLRGYKDALAMGINPKTVAYSAGMEVAKLVEKRVYPGTKEELKSTGDSISHAMFQNGFIAALANDTTFFTSKAAADFQKEALAGAGEKFLAANAKKPGVKVLPSGLQYKVITEGHGEVPKASDEVEVIYEGRLIDGTVFDATSKHGGSKTDKFRANGLIKGWTEALTLMPVDDHKSTDKTDCRILDKVAQSQHDERDQRINDQDIDLLQSFFDKYRGTQDCCKGSYCIKGLDLGRIT